LIIREDCFILDVQTPIKVLKQHEESSNTKDSTESLQTLGYDSITFDQTSGRLYRNWW